MYITNHMQIQDPYHLQLMSKITIMVQLCFTKLNDKLLEIHVKYIHTHNFEFLNLPTILLMQSLK